MELSKRLSAVAGLVTEGASVADIGTDHGYIPIWLAKRDPSVRLIAMDVNEGPCYGRTVCDELGVTKKAPNVRVGTGIDTDRFWDLVEECIRMYD